MFLKEICTCCSSSWQGTCFTVLQFLPIPCAGWFFFFLQGSSLHLEFLVNYICELSLLEYSLLCYLPSMVAASSVFLAKFILMPIKNPWNSSLSYYTRYTPSELRGCVRVLHRLFRLGPGSNLPAIREKYSQHKYKFVAKKYCPQSIPTKFFQDLTS